MSDAIVSSQVENRRFAPLAGAGKGAHVGSMEEYQRLWKESIDEPEKFWGKVAKELHWFKPWGKVLEWELPPSFGVVASGAGGGSEIESAALRHILGHLGRSDFRGVTIDVRFAA